jgi:long-subunit acyl-CoA synthetase (AMP-forming)
VDVRLVESDGDLAEPGDLGYLEVRGPNLFTGYWPDGAGGPGPDGWFATGDLGHVDADGFVWVSGRKKDIIINSSGHNMSSHRIEAVLREEVPQLAHAVVVGDGRPFNTALLVFEAGDDDGLTARVQSCVGRANARLARVEQIKRFRIVRTTWNPGSDELTPTMKLRRASINAKYAQDIEAMYARRRDDPQFLEPT